MKENLSIEELKMKNELLKNKTEKLRLTRNIVAVLSIILSLICFIFFGTTDLSSKNNNTPNSQSESSNSTETPQGNLDSDLDEEQTDID